MSVNIFDNLYKSLNERFPNRLISREITTNGQPLIEIEPDATKTKLYLKFIRAKKPDYGLERLITDFLCYAKTKNYTTVELEDDSLFNEADDCQVRTLYKRAFENKPSIYANPKYGFKSDMQINEMDSDKMRDVIYKFKIIDAKNLASVMLKQIAENAKKIFRQF